MAGCWGPRRTKREQVRAAEKPLSSVLAAFIVAGTKTPGRNNTGKKVYFACGLRGFGHGCLAPRTGHCRSRSKNTGGSLPSGSRDAEKEEGLKPKYNL